METKSFKSSNCDNNCENSQRDSNLIGCTITNFETEVIRQSSDVSSMERKQFELCRSKSDHSFVKPFNMGKKTSPCRSKSLNNVGLSSVKYESLKRNKVKIDHEYFEDSEDDYKILKSSDVDTASETSDDCAIEQTSTTQFDKSANRLNMQLLSSQPRTNGLLGEKYSTLPRINVKKENADHEISSRVSLSSLDSRENELERKSETHSELPAIDMPKNTQKTRNFKSTTLPKTRSRLGEHFLRHSLRRAINVNMSGKNSRPSEASKQGVITTPGNSESTMSEIELGDKANQTRNSFVWLRKSMRKLNPFQMPQCHVELPQDFQIPSTSVTNPCGEDRVVDKRHMVETPIYDLQSDNRLNNEVVASCNSNPDLFNIVLSEQQQYVDTNRPRQYGRRSNPVRISSFAIELSDNGAARIIAHHHQSQERRPASLPIQQLHNTTQSSVHRSRACLPSEPSSMASSRNSSPVSIVSSTGSSSAADPISAVNPRFMPSNRNDDEDCEGADGSDAPKIYWPHSLCRPICCMFCTLGLFNISRFAIFSVHFGANFLVQFMILSFIFGVPLFWLQMVLGQKIKGGIVTMFKITPICKGIGIALMITHCIISLYSSVSIAWLLIYLRDSVIPRSSKYLWQERFENFRSYQNITELKISENIADYFNGVVLQRLSGVSNTHDGRMRFQLAFSVSIVWILVFILLCRGIRSLGQIAIGLAAVSFIGLAAVSIKFLTLLSLESIQDIFPATDWNEFFSNSNSWSVAAQESFLTWGLLGVSVYACYCKTGENQRINPNVLRREAFLVVFLTLFGLFLGAVLGSTCIIILKLNGFNYFPASFENPKNDIFLWPENRISQAIPYQSIPPKWITRCSNIIGESFERPIYVSQQGIQIYKESGYKTIRLVTEILPSVLAINRNIEPGWGVIAFASLFLLGLGQLGMMWKPISGAIGRSTSAILLSCITGLFLGFPLTTDNGIVIIHFMDFIFGGSWFLLILWAIYIISIFMIRSRPFTSDVLVKDLRLTETFSAFLAFSWNVLLPVALILLSVMEYKKSHSNELFHQRNISSLNHLMSWQMWAKQLGGFLQLSMLILVPCVALVQIYIYLSKGSPDILDRIEHLFRPPMESPNHSHPPIRRLVQQNMSPSAPISIPLPNSNVIEINDAPPKYSPPPSYSKAIGIRVAKALRSSIRRSVRRFRRNGEPDAVATVESNLPQISTVSSSVSDPPRFSQIMRTNSEICQNVSRNINEFIRSTVHGNARGQSVENLMLSDISPDIDEINPNQ